MYMQQESDDLKRQERYSALLSWGLANGVKLLNVDMPAAFQPGLVGVVATQDIPSNTAIIAVPQSLIISQEKCLRSPLKTIYALYPDLFDQNVTQDAEFNVLILYLLCEKKKGPDSFYYPYIQAIQAKNLLVDWPEDYLKLIEDPLILQEFSTIRDDLNDLWLKVDKIIHQFPDLFGTDHETDKIDFYWAAQSVMSRCFGWSLKSTSMIPIADFLNHSNVACTHYVVHRKLEVTDQKHLQYIHKKKKLNLSILGIPQSLDQLPKHADAKVKLLQMHKSFLEENKIEGPEHLTPQEQRYLISKLNYDRMSNEDVNLWDLSFATSSDSEDNDSEDELDDFRAKQFEQLHKKEIDEYKKRKQPSDESIITVCLNQEKQNKIKIKGLPFSFYREKLESSEPNDSGNMMEQREQGQASDNGSDNGSDGQSQESSKSEESQWDWLDEDDDEGYFCITTTSPVKKHEQVHVSYGRRTNRFLLCWYGFALPENKYSSFNFRLWLNVDILRENKHTNAELFDLMTINKLMSGEDWEKGFIEEKGHKIPIDKITKEFRIKRTKLNQDLMMYFRLYLMVYYTGKDLKDVLVTIPVSLDYEIFVLSFGVKLLNHYLSKYSQRLTDDNVELEKDIPYEKRFALYINRERKEILVAQLMIMLEAIIILKRYKESEELKPAYLQDVQLDIFKKMNLLHSLKDYLKSIHDYI